MKRTWNFMGEKKGEYNYLFFLVSDAYWLHSEQCQRLTPMIEDVFSREIGDKGIVFSSFKEDINRNYEMIVHQKNWPDDVYTLLYRADAFMLTISKDFEKFNPENDPYILIQFYECFDEDKRIRDLLRQISMVIKDGQNLYKWWEKVASERKPTTLQKLLDAAEFKPGIWGFSVDLKKLFRWE